jgi:Uma2 family endonuclease
MLSRPGLAPATFADLLALPEGVRAEILDGVLVTPPSPLPEHSRAQARLSRFIGAHFDEDDGGGPDGWWIFVELDVQLSEHVIVRPDLVGWRRERLPNPWGQRPITTTPDWVCEVISPSNAAQDRVRKRRLYAAHGVPFYWIVDPASRTLEALRLVTTGDHVEWNEIGVYDDTSIARIAPFDAIELDVGRLFPPAAPTE